MFSDFNCSQVFGVFLFVFCGSQVHVHAHSWMFEGTLNDLSYFCFLRRLNRCFVSSSNTSVAGWFSNSNKGSLVDISSYSTFICSSFSWSCFPYSDVCPTFVLGLLKTYASNQDLPTFFFEVLEQIWLLEKACLSQRHITLSLRNFKRSFERYGYYYHWPIKRSLCLT